MYALACFCAMVILQVKMSQKLSDKKEYTVYSCNDKKEEKVVSFIG